MKKSTKILIIILALAIILPLSIAIYCHQKVKNNQYDHKHVEKLTLLIPNIEDVHITANKCNPLNTYIDGSSADTLFYYSYFYGRGYRKKTLDSIPRYAINGKLLTVESFFNKDTNYHDEVSYYISGEKLKNIKIAGRENTLYFYNSTKNVKETITFTITDSAELKIGENHMRLYVFDNKDYPYYEEGVTEVGVDALNKWEYKNINVNLSDGIFSINNNCKIDTLRIHATGLKTRINVGKNVEIKHIEGEIQSASLLQGNLKNVEQFQKIIKKE